MGLHLRVELTGHGQGVELRPLPALPHPLELVLKDRAVKMRVVSGDGTVADELHDDGQGLRRGGLAVQHLVGDVGQVRDLFRQGEARVHQDVDGIDHLAVGQLDPAELDHPVPPGIEARGFKVQHDDGLVHVRIVRVLHDVLVVRQVGFHAGDQLDAVLFRRAEGLGVRLNHAVVRHRDGLVAPAGRPLHQGGHGGDGVHRAHVGVHVELHPLFLGVVLAHGKLRVGNIIRADGGFLVEIVVLRQPAHHDAGAGLDLGGDVLRLFLFLRGDRGLVLPGRAAAAAAPVAQEGDAADGAGQVRHREVQDQHAAVLGLPRFDVQHLAADGDAAALRGDVHDGRGLGGDLPAADLHGGLLFLFRRFGDGLHQLLLRGALGNLPGHQGFRIAPDADPHLRIHPENIVDGLGQVLLDLAFA